MPSAFPPPPGATLVDPATPVPPPHPRSFRPARRRGLAAVSALLLAGCGGGGGGAAAPSSGSPGDATATAPTPAPDATRQVVVVGYQASLTDSSSQVGAYWSGGATTLLPVGARRGGSVATAVAWGPQDTITAGYYPFEGGPSTIDDEPKLWHRGEIAQALGGDFSGHARANAIAVTSSDVYAAGYHRVGELFKALYWKNGNPVYLTDVDDGGLYEAAYGIAVAAGDVHVVGHDFFVVFNPVYWKNGVRSKLSTQPGGATGVAVVGSQVHVSGSVRYAGTVGNTAVVWTNGVAQNLTDGTTTNATALAIDAVPKAGGGIDVYVAGADQVASSGQVARLWKNGTLQPLEGAVAGSIAQAVRVVGDDVHVAGHVDGNGTSQAALWVNGRLQRLTSGTLRATATGVAVR